MSRPCSVNGCDRRGECKGMCRMHYKRWVRRGTTDDWDPRQHPAPTVDPARYADLIEDVEWIIGSDTPENTARRLGYRSVEALQFRLRSLGRPDLSRRLGPAHQGVAS